MKALKGKFMRNIKTRDKIIYIPYPVKGTKINEYTLNMIKILEENYSVCGTLADLRHILEIVRTKAVFLNWVETRLNTKLKIQLMFYKLLGSKIIWVFHNKYPHDTPQSNDIICNMNWLAQKSSVIILHSKSSKKYIPSFKKNIKKAVYVPHILYDSHNEDVDLNTIKAKYGISNENFVFTIFGGIKPYKNIETGVKVFGKLQLNNAKLLIVGNPFNGMYAKQIGSMCKDNPNIILDLRYIPDSLLDSIIDISDVVVMPYKEGSSMNSGVMMKSFSKGKTVIMPDICMARDLAGNRFFYIYKESFEKVMEKAYNNGKDINKRMGEQAKEYIRKNNNRKIVKKLLDQILT